MRSLMQSSEGAGGGDFIDRLNTSIAPAGDESSLLRVRGKPIPHVDLDGCLDELIRLPAGLATNFESGDVGGGDSTIGASQRFHQTASMMSIYQSTQGNKSSMSRTSRKPALPSHVLEGIAKAKRSII